MTNTRSGMTPAAIEEMINRRVTKALETCEANRNIGLGNGNDEGGNGNDNGNRNGGGNVNHNENDRDDRPVVRGWFEKMETVFHISNCPEKYQVKYATYTLLNSALTWWNSHKRTIGTNAAFAMSWRELMKLMAENNDLAAYTQRFQELTMLCTKMVLEEEDRVEKFIRGLPDNIQGNLKGYAMKNAKNKRKLDNSQKDNRGQQPSFKRQNVRGQNVVRAYTAGNNEMRVYNVPLPLYNKCKFHQERSRTVRCGKCNKVGHLTRDCKAIISTTSTQRGQNRGNKTGNKSGIGEARGKSYVLGGGDANPESNVVMGTFLLNNHYASVLFDSGADQSFVSTTFSILLDIIPDTLDVSYAVELADIRTSETNTVLKGFVEEGTKDKLEEKKRLEDGHCTRLLWRSQVGPLGIISLRLIIISPSAKGGAFQGTEGERVVEESEKEVDSDLLSDARSRPGPAKSGGRVRCGDVCNPEKDGCMV
ncbi:reverse transcriptase domain-containing protein, partial [Tanacetum coccineum]